LLQLAWCLLVLVVLALAWEHYARSFSAHSGVAHALESLGAVHYVPAGVNDLKRVLEEMPAPRRPRVLVLGSSQIATVKEGERPQSMPFVIQREMTGKAGPSEVVDLSAGGQATIEGTLVLLGSLPVVRPDAVVIGVSLYSMQGVAVRESILAAFDVGRLADLVREDAPADVPPPVLHQLLAFRQQASQPVHSRGETIQQKLDRRLAVWLEARSAAVRYHEVMYDELLDIPIRRDLVAYVKRNYQGIRVASNYGIVSAYAPSMAAIEVVSRQCARQGIPLLVVALPYDASIDPIPYPPKDQEQFIGDMTRMSASDRFELLDESRALTHEDFGVFVDGSPDGLHFRAHGHEVVGGAIARRLGELLSSGANHAIPERPGPG
jgi:hypothetical protein